MQPLEHKVTTAAAADASVDGADDDSVVMV
jgi:hypothetical protein